VGGQHTALPMLPRPGIGAPVSGVRGWELRSVGLGWLRCVVQPSRTLWAGRRTIFVALVALLAAAGLIFYLTYQPTRPGPLRAVFIGDSYTHGTGASTPERRWSTLVSRSASWDEVNLGLGGTGYVATSGPAGCGRPACPNYLGVLAAAAEAKPDVVVVAGGQNDFRAYGEDPAGVVNKIDQTYRELRRLLPEARIIAVGPSTPTGSGDTLRSLDSAVRESADRVGAEYISLLDPPVITPGMVAPDGAHVNDRGHEAIAERVLTAVQG
jgi:lysophospholipase L1-like esterase